MDKVLDWPERALTWLLRRTNGFVYVLLLLAASLGWILFSSHVLARFFSYVTASLIGPVGVIIIIMLFLLPFRAQAKRRGEANQYFMDTGGAWVEWTCTPEEWQRFVAAETQYRRPQRIGSSSSLWRSAASSPSSPHVTPIRC